ncbi:hypothetical protein SAMN05192580_3329 [Sphingomonas jatrophae]|uniref:Uncharacterized protein n=2 Tax=Sphingomonas jatrophae TaxID=1166337 RepID=A0A1I6M264_9SPHN|nr:hypothetical protein SAMN05192580_3329 [Sphingomonas jatrophae]
MKPVQVGSHRFEVPDEHVLPASGPGALSAVLNPQAPLQEQTSILVQAVADVCNPGTPPVIDQLPRACAVARGQAEQPQPGRLTRKLRFPDDPTQYDYHGEDGGVAVSCSGDTPGAGSCGAIYAWRDLIWSARFREADVPRLEEIRADVARKLDQWSVKEGARG